MKKVPVGDNAPWLIRVLREVRALEKLQKHQNIINYKHSWLVCVQSQLFSRINFKVAQNAAETSAKSQPPQALSDVNLFRECRLVRRSWPIFVL